MLRIILALLLLATAAQAQTTVKQSGTVTPGHATRWTTTGVIQDGGTAQNGSLTSLGVTATGSGICQNSAAVTAAGYQQICLGATTAGGGFLSVQRFGTATAQPLTFNINGTPITLPTGGGAIPTVTLPTVNGDFICASGTGGTLADCGFSTVPLASGGTGATTATGARTSLGLGTMAVQNATAVAITGGTITGLPTPSASSDAVPKSYADGIASGITIHSPARLGTAAILPNTPTYSNGTLGVGATLTAGSNTSLTVDGTTANLNDRVLVKNQGSAFQNGVYTVTTAGDGSNAWVLTRATDFDTAAEMTAGSYFLVTAGSTNTGSAYTLQTTIVTVGSSSVNFLLFSQGGLSAGGTSGQIQYNASGLLGGFTASGDATINTSTGAITVTKSNGSSFGTAAFVNTGTSAGTVPLLNGNNTFSGTSVFSGDVYFGSGRPWVDVRSGTNGCAAAVGNSVTDDTAAIQCQATFLNANFAGGVLYFPPGNYKVTSTITIAGGTTLQGAGVGVTVINGQSSDFNVLFFTGNYGGLNNIFVSGTQSTSATTSTVIFASGIIQNTVRDCNIWGGAWALEMRNTDSLVENCFVAGFGTAGGNLFSNGGNNWYVRVKFDAAALTSNRWGVLIRQGVTVGALENTFDACDFSGNFTDASLFIDDGTGLTAFTTISNSTFNHPIQLVRQQWTGFSVSKLGANLTLSSGAASIVGSRGLGAITATGAICAGNSNITC